MNQCWNCSAKCPIDQMLQFEWKVGINQNVEFWVQKCQIDQNVAIWVKN